MDANHLMRQAIDRQPIPRVRLIVGRWLDRLALRWLQRPFR